MKESNQPNVYSFTSCCLLKQVAFQKLEFEPCFGGISMYVFRPKTSQLAKNVLKKREYNLSNETYDLSKPYSNLDIQMDIKNWIR